MQHAAHATRLQVVHQPAGLLSRGCVQERVLQQRHGGVGEAMELDGLDDALRGRPVRLWQRRVSLRQLFLQRLLELDEDGAA
eukprot:12027484-Alexandrium_andersonii.AAC.1